MKYVLILILMGGDGVAVDHIEFPSQNTCTAAGVAVQKPEGRNKVTAYCLPLEDEK